MIGCVGPASSSADHTLNTLRYADRLKGKRRDYSQEGDQEAPESDDEIIVRLFLTTD